MSTPFNPHEYDKTHWDNVGQSLLKKIKALYEWKELPLLKANSPDPFHSKFMLLCHLFLLNKTIKWNTVWDL